MDLRPNITSAFYGNHDTIKTLQERLALLLPQDSVEWQRSYGRGTRQVKIRATFLEYSPDLAVFEPAGKLVLGLHQIPILHIFWIGETDTATFGKSGGKESLSQWFKVLQENQCPNYLVITVEDLKKTGKGTSVYEKVKNEFSAKQPNRCYNLRILNISNKESYNDIPAWNGLAARIRQLMVSALTRLMLRCEDFVRERREQCRSLHWHYSDYFLLQEQMAFLLETWGCLNESLVQYDELDAMFSQFVINAGSGHVPAWLEDFCQSSNIIEGLPVGRTVAMKYRQLLRDRCATLLDMRNHVYSRQAMLLCEMGRGAEAAQRALPFMHATLHEIDVLQVTNVPGATESWVYLSCFQVIGLIDSLLSTAQSSESKSMASPLLLHKANLVYYAQQKLYKLGGLCGLTNSAPPESERVDVPSLIAGCIALQSEAESPSISRLCQAICSVDEFKNHYVDLSEQARQLFKQHGRHRQASVVAVELAKFYVQCKDYALAEPLLLDACSGHGRSHLPSILAQNIALLAECWKALERTDKYLLACAVLASTTSPLPPGRHEKYLSCLQAGDANSEGTCTLPAKPLIVVKEITSSTPEVRPNQPIQVSMSLVSTAPQNLQCECITLRLRSLRRARRFTAHQYDVSLPKRKQAGRFSMSSVVFNQLQDVPMSASEDPRLSVSGSLSPNEEENSFLKVPSSGQNPCDVESLFSAITLGAEDLATEVNTSRDILLSAKNVVLSPGVNSISMASESSLVGQLTASMVKIDFPNVQLAMTLNSSTPLRLSTLPVGNLGSSLESVSSAILKPRSGRDPFTIDVVPAEPGYSIQFQLASGESRSFFANTKESVLLSIETRDEIIEHFVALVLQPVPGLTFQLPETLVANLTCSDSEENEEVTLNWHSVDNGQIAMDLPSLKSHSHLVVAMELELEQSIMEEDGSDTQLLQSSRRSKVLPTVTRELKAVLDDGAVEHTERISCRVCIPLQLSHRLHRTPKGTFVQVLVHAYSDCKLAIKLQLLVAESGHELKTAFTHKTLEAIELDCNEEYSTMWSTVDDTAEEDGSKDQILSVVAEYSSCHPQAPSNYLAHTIDLS